MTVSASPPFAVAVVKNGFVDRLLAASADAARDVDLAYQCVGWTMDADALKTFKTRAEAKSVAREFGRKYVGAHFVVVAAVYGIKNWQWPEKESVK